METEDLKDVIAKLHDLLQNQLPMSSVWITDVDRCLMKLGAEKCERLEKENFELRILLSNVCGRMVTQAPLGIGNVWGLAEWYQKYKQERGLAELINEAERKRDVAGAAYREAGREIERLLIDQNKVDARRMEELVRKPERGES